MHEPAALTVARPHTHTQAETCTHLSVLLRILSILLSINAAKIACRGGGRRMVGPADCTTHGIAIAAYSGSWVCPLMRVPACIRNVFDYQQIIMKYAHAMHLGEAPPKPV